MFLDPRPPIILTMPDCDRLLAIAEQQRIRQPEVADLLETEIARARVVDPLTVPPDTVTMHSHVTFGYDHSPRSHWLTLVYPREANLDLARISVATPVGAALIGLREGQSIAWTTASGVTRRITLNCVAYQPERAGRHDL